MKVCRKCKTEYKEDYSFCPKCGTPYDVNGKYAKIPGTLNGANVNVFIKIWNIFLYCFGGLLILVYLSTITQNLGESIFAILFGLSLFQVFYKLISDKFPKLDEKYLKIARVVLPIMILIIWMICYPASNSSDSKNANSTNEQVETNNNSNDMTNNIDNKDSSTEVSTDTTVTTTTSTTTTTTTQPKTVYSLNYNELGEFGKRQEYEGVQDIFYYIPSGTYDVTRTSGKDKYCFLWLFYKKSYQDTYGTEYNSKEKFTYSSNNQTQTVTITDDVMVYNSNTCSYTFEKK